MKLKEALSLNPKQEALWLLEKATNMSATQLRLLDENTELTPEAEQSLMEMTKQRRSGVPLQYILGQWEFMGLTMKCRSGVLIPRGDTELLAGEAIVFLREYNCQSPAVLDLCCGSGCIGVAIAKLCPSSRVVSTDIEAEALELAQENAKLNKVEDRMHFVQSDLFSKIEGRFHCIIANPPYIPSNEIPKLAAELKHEPIKALDGGPEGMDFYRAIIPKCREYLKPKGGVFLEIGTAEQAKAVSEILHNNNYKGVVIIKDLEDRQRAIRALI